MTQAVRRRGLLTRWELALGVVLVGALLSWALPRIQRATWRTRCAEVGLILSSLQEAQEAAHARSGAWFPVAGVPQGADEVGRHRARWPATLPGGWTPPTEQARCSYAARAEGGELVVTATCDVDGDGERSVFRLDRGGNVIQLTPEGVW